jgi:hypothetical protein
VLALAAPGSTVYADAGTTPPTVTISTPTAADTYSTSVTPITLTGTATPVDPATISSVAWSNSAGGSGSCTVTTAWTCSNITLYSGTNTLTVTATDSLAVIGSDILTVTFDNTVPTLLTSPAPTIAANGTTLTLTFSEAVQNGAGGSGGWAITPSGGSATVTYSSGSGTASLVYTISRRILNETVTLTYTQPGNGVEDILGNDLVTISTPRAVTNNSDYTAPTITSITSTTIDGTYGVGDSINVTVNFSEAVTSTGNVTVTLETGVSDGLALSP